MEETKFKHTEIGLIPADWNLQSVGNDCTVKARIGWQGLTTSEYMQHGKYGLITSTDIVKGKINWKTCFFVNKFRYEQDKNIIVKEGDILVSKDGTIGKVGIVSDMPYPATLNSGVFVIRNKDIKMQNATTLAFISPYFKDFIKRLTAGSTIVHLYQKDIVKFTYPAPKELEEQYKIASALKSVDNLLLALDKLIEKKKLIKQGAMQELLTGKKRLPGFDGEWISYKLEDLGTFSKGSGINRSESNSGNLPAVRYGEIYTHHNNIICRFYTWISLDIASKSKKIKCGDILFTASGETKEDIGKCVAYNFTCDAYAGGDIIILSPKDIFDSIFLGYLLNSEYVCRQKSSKGQGDAVVHITYRSLSQIKCFIPKGLEEQKVIASILSGMDKELESLEAKKEKYEQIKQGMMQQLLTGKIRLITE